MKIVKYVLLAAWAVAAVSTASPASADIYVYGYSAATEALTISGSTAKTDPGGSLINGTYRGAQGLAYSYSPYPNEGAVPSIELLNLPVFCVDLIHEIGSGYAPPLDYAAFPITTNSLGTLSGTPGMPPLLTLAQSEEIGWLAGAGIDLINNPGLDGDGDWEDDVSAYQGAIWQVEYGGIVTAANSDPNVNAEIAALVLAAGGHQTGGFANGLYSVNGDTQGFSTNQGFATGGGTSVNSFVPEPGIWLMLLIGFFATGFMMRRPTRNQVFATA